MPNLAEPGKDRIGLVLVSLETGGLENVVFNLYSNLKKAGQEVTVFVETDKVGYYASRVALDDIVVLKNRLDEFFTEIARRKINILNYHYSAFGLLEAKKIGVATIYTLHNCYTWMDDDSFVERAALIEQCDHIIAVSTFVKNYYINRSGSQLENISVILNGIDVESLRGAKPIKRRQFSLSENKFIFAQFASFYPVKHQLVAIRAAEKLLAIRNDFELIFFGNVGDKYYFDEICTEIERSPARSHIRYLGNLPNEQVPGVLLGCVDCALATTMQEGNSISILEAACLGVPIIMTRTGSFEDLQKLGLDISYVPLPLNTTAINPNTIARTSRNGLTDNLIDIVLAMQARLEGHANTRNARVDLNKLGDFPYSDHKMTEDYLRVFGTMQKIR